MRLKEAALVFCLFVHSFTARAEVKKLPDDVSDYLSKQIACNYLFSEAQGDSPDRKKLLSDKIIDIKCDEIENDLALLEQKYLCPFQNNKGSSCQLDLTKSR